MTEVEARQTVGAGRRPRIWPLSVKAYHALGEMGLIPEKTELLYGQVFHKMPKSPIHSLHVLRLYELLRPETFAGFHVRQEHPITCAPSESVPEPDLSVIRCSIGDYRT